MTEQSDVSSADPESSISDELLPIRDVVRLTGVNPVTLRAWERRYGMIQPLRTEGGHRLYSPQDVATIRNIMTWIERGIAVSKVGDLLARSKSLETAVRPGTSSEPDSEPVPLNGVLHACREWQLGIRQAVAAFDEARLEQLYGQIFSSWRLPLVFEEVLLPVWHELMHQTGFGQRSQWLFYDAFLRARVLQRLQLARLSGEQKILLAALPEQCRELELLVAGLLLGGDSGAVQVVAVGQPLEELPLLCQAIQPHVLVLFAPAPPNANGLQQLRKLALAVDCPVALAGLGADLAEEQLKGSPIASLGGKTQLMQQRLRQFINGHLDT